MMKCPFCGYAESKVVDSRPAPERGGIRRRRECLECTKRYTTYEVIEALQIVVCKRDGSQQSFDRAKLMRSILRACEKRTVKLEQIEHIVDSIESSFQNNFRAEVTSTEIGEEVLRHLRTLDKVAYVRFASVYHQFTDLESFANELRSLSDEQN